MTLRESMRLLSGRTQTAIYEQAIEDFEALYPNITVNLRLYTDYGKIYNDVITNISTNTTPNCLHYLSGSHCDLFGRNESGGSVGRTFCA